MEGGFCVGLGFPSYKNTRFCTLPNLSVSRHHFCKKDLRLTLNSNNRFKIVAARISESRTNSNRKASLKRRRKKKNFPSCREENPKTPSSNLRPECNENGNPLGQRELSKNVVRWVIQGMSAMAADLSAAEELGEVADLTQQMSDGIAFVVQAQHFLAANPMPKGLEALCLKASTHYSTLFDHFQRELRDQLQALQKKSVIQDWRETESWKLLKKLTKSGVQFIFSYAL